MLTTELTDVRPEEIDFKSADFIANPYPYYDLMRRTAPILYREDWRMHFLSAYEDVDALLRDSRLGRQFSHVMSRQEVGLCPIPPAHAPFYAMSENTLMSKEPPAHTRLKNLVKLAFTPRMAEKLRPRARHIAETLIERARPSGRIDLLEGFAAPLSVQVISELLGVPERDQHRLRPWSSDIVAMYELGGDESHETAMQAVRAVEEFSDYLKRLVRQRRREPQEDLLTALVAAEADGDRLSEQEFISTCILILNAGHEATVNVVGNGMLALLRHPDQLEKLRGDPSLLRPAVEEMMRYDTPLPLFRRWALTDIDYKGVRFERGTEVAFLLGAANRDRAQFENPSQFDITRWPNPHISFGVGVHYCLGAPLARVELQEGVAALLERLPKMRLAAETFEYQPTFVFRGVKSLPVTMA